VLCACVLESILSAFLPFLFIYPVADVFLLGRLGPMWSCQCRLIHLPCYQVSECGLRDCMQYEMHSHKFLTSHSNRNEYLVLALFPLCDSRLCPRPFPLFARPAHTFAPAEAQRIPQCAIVVIRHCPNVYWENASVHILRARIAHTWHTLPLVLFACSVVAINSFVNKI